MIKLSFLKLLSVLIQSWTEEDLQVITMRRFILFISLCFSPAVKLTSAFTLPNLYPFGVSEGDQIVPRNDDSSSGEVPISITFPFFDQNHRSLYVSITTSSSLNNFEKLIMKIKTIFSLKRTGFSKLYTF